MVFLDDSLKSIMGSKNFMTYFDLLITDRKKDNDGEFKL